MSNLKFRQFDPTLDDFMFFELNNGCVHIINSDIESFDKDRAGSPQEQFTGLRASHRVDVYAGDIVRFDVIKGNLDHDQYHRNQIGEVRNAPNGVSFGGWRYGWVCNIEVIGNIHQNPELLEQNDE